MNSFSNFMEEVLRMPYYKNYAAASGAVHNVSKHEDAVQDLLESHGFRDSNLPSRKSSKSPISLEDRDLALHDETNLLGIPNNSYVSQPCGTHASPDFIVNHEGKLYFLECKSSKQTYPTFNSGLPCEKYIYLFASERVNETTVFMGDDIVDSEQRAIIAEGHARIQEILAEMNEELKLADSLNRGIDYYNRPMFTQKGGASKSNYFEHANRRACEERVLKYVS